MGENSGGSTAGSTDFNRWLQALITEKSLTLDSHQSNEIPTDESDTKSLMFLSSEDFGDPTLHEVLQWHIVHCFPCTNHQFDPPPAFGKADKRHCEEYFEIVQEYSDYERDYVSKGNP